MHSHCLVVGFKTELDPAKQVLHSDRLETLQNWHMSWLHQGHKFV